MSVSILSVLFGLNPTFKSTPETAVWAVPRTSAICLLTQIGYKLLSCYCFVVERSLQIGVIPYLISMAIFPHTESRFCRHHLHFPIVWHKRVNHPRIWPYSPCGLAGTIPLPPAVPVRCSVSPAISSITRRLHARHLPTGPAYEKPFTGSVGFSEAAPVFHARYHILSLTKPH